MAIFQFGGGRRRKSEGEVSVWRNPSVDNLSILSGLGFCIIEFSLCFFFNSQSHFSSIAESETSIRFEILFKLELGLIRQRLGNTFNNFDKYMLQL